MPVFHLANFLGIRMIVRQRRVYVCNVQTKALGDPDRCVSTTLDALSDIPNRDSAAANVRFLVDRRIRCGNDSVLRSAS